MTKTSRALLAAMCGLSVATLMLTTDASPAPARPAPSTTPVPEVITWCADESKINGGKFYAWMVHRC